MNVDVIAVYLMSGSPHIAVYIYLSFIPSF